MYIDPYFEADHSYYQICNEFKQYSNLISKKGINASVSKFSPNVIRYVSLLIAVFSVVFLLVIISSIDNNFKL